MTEHQQQLSELLADPCDGRNQEIVLGHSSGAPHPGEDAEVIWVENRRKQPWKQRVGHPCGSTQPVGVEVHVTPHTSR